MMRETGWLSANGSVDDVRCHLSSKGRCFPFSLLGLGSPLFLSSALGFLSSALGFLSSVQAAAIVRSEQAVYYVTPGETIDIHIHIDANDQTLGNAFEPLPSGLFSFGVRATFPSGSASVLSVGQVTPAAQLDFFGLSAGAMKQVTSNSASAKGNIELLLGSPYTGSQLLTIQVTNLAPISSSYLVELDEWRTLGSNEQIFVAGDGTVLDTTPSSNLFLPALIIVVPEPSSFCLLLLVALSAVGVRHRYGDVGRWGSNFSMS